MSNDHDELRPRLGELIRKLSTDELEDFRFSCGIQLDELPDLTAPLAEQRRRLRRSIEGMTERWPEFIQILERLLGEVTPGLHQAAPGEWVGAGPWKYKATYKLPVHRLVGRVDERNEIQGWLSAALARSQPQQLQRQRVCCIYAFGGVGKSHLVWDWFGTLCSPEGGRLTSEYHEQGLAGAYWTSFYIRGYDMPQFVRDALAFVNELLGTELPGLPPRQALLAQIKALAAEERRVLLVLDGLERQMEAYASGERETVEHSHASHGTPRHKRRLFMPEDDDFLEALALSGALLLVTSRLRPRALEDLPLLGGARPVHWLEMKGLIEQDALALLETSGSDKKLVFGDETEMKRFLKQFNHHPLVITLASRAVSQGKYQGDFNTWRAEHPEIDDIVKQDVETERRLSMLSTLLSSVADDPESWAVLDVIAFYSGETSMRRLDKELVEARKVFADHTALRSKAVDLVNLGLIGEEGGSFDMHPLVRHTVAMLRAQSDGWKSMRDEERKRLGMDADTPEARSSSIHLFHSEIAAGEYGRAWDGYQGHVRQALNHDLCSHEDQLHYLKMLFPRRRGNIAPWLDVLPQVSSRAMQIEILREVAGICQHVGLWPHSDRLVARAEALALLGGETEQLARLFNLRSWGEVYRGRLKDAEQHLDHVCRIAQIQDRQIAVEASFWLGMVRGICGRTSAVEHVKRAIDLSATGDHRRYRQGLAEVYLYLGRNLEALDEINNLGGFESDPADGPGQLGWELVNYCLAAVRLEDARKRIPEVEERLERAFDLSRRTDYTVVTAFAYAAKCEVLAFRKDYYRIETIACDVFNSGHRVATPEHPDVVVDDLALSTFQIPAVDVLITLARTRLQRGEREAAMCAARAALAISGPSDVSHVYGRGVVEASSFLGVPVTLSEFAAVADRASKPRAPADGEADSPVVPAATAQNTFSIQAPNGAGRLSIPPIRYGDEEDDASNYQRIMEQLGWGNASAATRDWWRQLEERQPRRWAYRLARFLVSEKVSAEAFVRASAAAPSVESAGFLSQLAKRSPGK